MGNRTKPGSGVCVSTTFSLEEFFGAACSLSRLSFLVSMPCHFGDAKAGVKSFGLIKQDLEFSGAESQALK